MRSKLVAADADGGTDLRAESGHDDLVMAVALACLRLRMKGAIGGKGERLI